MKEKLLGKKKSKNKSNKQTKIKGDIKEIKEIVDISAHPSITLSTPYWLYILLRTFSQYMKSIGNVVQGWDYSIMLCYISFSLSNNVD